MTRKSPETVLVSDLPVFLLALRDAEPVALAIAAQAEATLKQADELGDTASDVVITAIRTQGDKLNEASHEVRSFAKWNAAGRPAAPAKAGESQP
jgi:hypothetical protein